MSKINQRKNFATLLVKNPPDKFKAIFEATPVAVVEGVWSRAFDVMAVNASALELFAAQDQAKFFDGFNGVLTKIPRKILLELLSARLKGDLFEAEFPLPTFKRTTIWVFMRLAYMPDSQVGTQHVVLAFYDITSRKRQETFLKRLAQVDGLTGLLNHRTILQRLEEEISRARRYQVNLSCVIFDLDNFKKVNDTFGHLAGDRHIRHATQALKNAFRKTDVLGRLGGDEFLAILPETTPEEAAIPVGRFLKTYQDQAEIKRKDKAIKTSFSVGIAGFPCQGIESEKDLVSAADQALYMSKTMGGNCYNLYASKTGKTSLTL